MKIRLRPDTVLSKKQLKKLDEVTAQFPPENALDFYERRLASCDHSKLQESDQEAALSILKILQSLN